MILAVQRRGIAKRDALRNDPSPLAREIAAAVAAKLQKEQGACELVIAWIRTEHRTFIGATSTVGNVTHNEAVECQLTLPSLDEAEELLAFESFRSKLAEHLQRVGLNLQLGSRTHLDGGGDGSGGYTVDGEPLTVTWGKH